MTNQDRVQQATRTAAPLSRQYRDAPLVGVGALVWRGDRDEVLLVLRGREPNRHLWALPGGLVEIGETLAEAMVREVLEETGLRVTPGPLIGSFEPIERDEQGRVRYHYVVLDYLAYYQDGEPQAADDADATAWFRMSDLAGLNMLPATREMIAKGFELAHQGR